jgi:hypothetical protein
MRAQEDQKPCSQVEGPENQQAHVGSPRKDGPGRTRSNLPIVFHQGYAKILEHGKTSIVYTYGRRGAYRLLLSTAEQDYHPIHAIQLDVDRFAWGPLPHWSYHHSTCADCDRDRPNRVDALPPRFSSHSRRLRVDGMDLDSHGLRHLWHRGISLRSLDSYEHSWRERRTRHSILLQCDERDREFFTDPVRRSRVFAFIPGDRASIIPPSQSSVPFFIRKTLIRSNPASINHDLASDAL